MYLIGFDIGSSSVKAAIVDAESRQTIATVRYPESEMRIAAPHPGWAEQDPDFWWEAVCQASRMALQKSSVDAADIGAIGIAYQMHGLVLCNRQGQALRPSIIWCDNRAIQPGHALEQHLGTNFCLEHYLNTPGNFTAAKLKWVLDQEPAIAAQIYKIMLPGDYIALKMTGTFTSTVSGLSEGILWDFKQKQPALELLEAMGLDNSILPEIHDSCGHHGQLNADAARMLGLRPGTPLTYRAGDQPNNALALNVLQPGEIAASGGTSGVVYAVSDGVRFDPAQRVNTFAHVNYSAENTRTGVLLCINGTGSLYQWLRRNIAANGMTYNQMEQQAAAAGPGADGLLMLPFGNGAERMLGNRDLGAQVHGLQFNRHTQGHLYRAALEGIVFAFAYGIHAMREMGIPVKVMRAGNDGLFQSEIFAQSLADLVGTEIQLLETNGAAGAAKAAGLIVGAYPSLEAATAQTHLQNTFQPAPPHPALLASFEQWQQLLQG